MSLLDRLNPYALALRLGVIAVGIAAMFALVFSWSSRGQDIARLEAWQSAVVSVTTDATVSPDAKGIRKPLPPEAVPAAIASIRRSLVSCEAGRETANAIVAEAVKRADNSDRALATANVLFSNEYGSVSKRIEALSKVKAAPTPELQCQAVGADSKAAWEGWK